MQLKEEKTGYGLEIYVSLLYNNGKCYINSCGGFGVVGQTEFPEQGSAKKKEPLYE